MAVELKLRQSFVAITAMAVLAGMVPSVTWAAEDRALGPLASPSPSAEGSASAAELMTGRAKLRVRVRGTGDRRARVVVIGPLETPEASGKRRVKRTKTLSLPKGTYTIKAKTAGVYVPRIAGARRVTSAKAPDVVRAKVKLSRSKKVRVRYRQASAKVVVKGLPKGTLSNIRIKGSNGWSRTVATSGAKYLHSMPKGWYRVEAGSVGRYSPSWGNKAKHWVASRSKKRIIRIRVSYKRIRQAPEPNPTPPPVPNPDWNAMTLPPLAIAAGGEGSGPPVYRNSEVTEVQGVAVSLEPTLKFLEGTPGRQYKFELLKLGDTVPFWQAQSGTNSLRIPSGVLQDSTTYEWSVTDVGTKEKLGPFVMSVDTSASGKQYVLPTGPFSVGVSSGLLTTGQTLGGVETSVGSLRISAYYLPGAAPQPGMPANWQMGMTGIAWQYVKVLEHSVELTTPSGTHVPYVPTAKGGEGMYRAVLPEGQKSLASIVPLLVRNADGSWTATNAKGGVFVFGSADNNGVAWLRTSYSGLGPEPVFDYTDGRLSSITDEATGMSIKAHYQGDSQCPVIPQGFVTPPEGTFCAVSTALGTVSGIYYLKTGTGALVLARIANFPETKDSKPAVTDFGYDQGGRIVSLRSPVVANVLAAGSRTDSEALLFDVEYDGAERVARVTVPAVEEGSDRHWFAAQYDTAHSRTAVSASFATKGPITTVDFDPNTFSVLKQSDMYGNWTSYEWNRTFSQLKSQTTSRGEQSSLEYDDSGWVSKITGPWPTGEPISNKTPQTITKYDQEVDPSTGTTRDMKGFGVVYWTNSDLNGVPAGRSSGPQIGDDVPAQVQWTWQEPPVGGDGEPWGARLLGKLDVPSDGLYDFSIVPAGSASLWIAGTECANGTCNNLPLREGVTDIRIDSHTGPTGGAMSIAVEWAKDGQPLAVMSTSDVRPGYGLSSYASSRQSLDKDTSVNKEIYLDYDVPWTGVQTNGWTGGASDVQHQATYAPIDVTKGQYGELESTTMPSGSKTEMDYWGPQELATPPCEGMPAMKQNGSTKSVTSTVVPGSQGDDGGTVTTQYWYNEMNQLVAASTAGHDPICYYRNDVGQTVRTASQDGAIEVEVSSLQDMGGNPLIQGVRTKSDETWTEWVQTDIFGKPVVQVGTRGEVTTTVYHPKTNKFLEETVTFGAFSSTMSYAYDSSGNLNRIDFDGEVFAEIDRVARTAVDVTYANGVVAHVTLTDQGDLKDLTYTDSAGKTFSYDVQTGIQGNILGENFMFDGKAANYEYGYDLLGRLAHASLTTDMDVAAKDWQFEFEGTPGLNSNRTSMTVDGKQTKYEYNQHDQLISTDDPSIGDQVEYSDLGEITRLGDLVISYNSASNPVLVRDTKSGDQIEYLYYYAGHLKQKNVTRGGVTTVTKFASQGLVLDENDKPVLRTITLGGAQFTKVLTDPSGASDSTTYFSGRGNKMWSADAQGRDRGKYGLYSPFGESLTEVSTPGPHEQRYDWQGFGLATDRVGLDDVMLMGSRLYVPKLGRFTSRDGIYGGSANAYDYANQDPVGQSDPSGLLPFVAELVVYVGATTASVLMGGKALAVIASKNWSAGASYAAGMFAEAFINGTIWYGAALINDIGTDHGFTQVQKFETYGMMVLSVTVSSIALRSKLAARAGAAMIKEAAGKVAADVQATVKKTVEGVQPMVVQAQKVVQDAKAAGQAVVESIPAKVEEGVAKGTEALKAATTAAVDSAAEAATPARVGVASFGLAVCGGVAVTTGATLLASAAMVAGTAGVVYAGYNAGKNYLYPEGSAAPPAGSAKEELPLIKDGAC